ncbi:MAG: methyltransferase domain-containing protein [Desulfomonile tiedjei]|nr:methyltransferase domain-containing protein [Desulfomonile tiedjei]
MPEKSNNDSQLRDILSHFDQSAKAWNDLYTLPTSANDVVLQNRLAFALELLSNHLPTDSTVLDVGCGPGIDAIGLARRGYKVKCVDISPQMVGLSKRNFADCGLIYSDRDFVVGDFMQADFGTGPFDGILALGFLEYQTDELAVIRRFRELLRPGGVLIVSGPIKRSLSTLFGATVFIRGQRGGKSLTVNRYSVGRMTQLLAASGFQVKDFVRHGFANFPLVEKNFGLKGGLWLQGFLTKVSRFLPIKTFCNDIVVAATRI